MKFLQNLYNLITEGKPALYFATQELLAAEREDLRAKSALDLAEAMVLYNSRRIIRLRKLVSDTVKNSTK